MRKYNESFTRLHGRVTEFGNNFLGGGMKKAGRSQLWTRTLAERYRFCSNCTIGIKAAIATKPTMVPITAMISGSSIDARLSN